MSRAKIFLACSLLIATTTVSIPAEETKAPGIKRVEEIGNKIIKRLTKKMTRELKGAITENGFSDALSYCHTKAASIVKDITNEFKDISVKRVTDRPRNPKDKLDDYDILAFNYFKTHRVKKSYTILIKRGKKRYYRYYQPIYIKSLCLGCHGKKDKIEKGVLDRLKKYYPDDMATGYKKGDLRGLFRVEIPDKDL